MKLVETEHDKLENNYIPTKGRSGDKLLIMQNDKQKKKCYFIFND